MDRVSGFWEEEVRVVFTFEGSRRLVRAQVDELQKAGQLRVDTLEKAIKTNSKELIPEAVEAAGDRLSLWSGDDENAGIKEILSSQRNLFAPPQEEERPTTPQMDAFRFGPEDVALQNMAHGRTPTPRDAWALLKLVGIEVPFEYVQGWSQEDVSDAATWAYARYQGADDDIVAPRAVMRLMELMAGTTDQLALPAGVSASEEIQEGEWAPATEPAALRKMLRDLGDDVPLSVIVGWTPEEVEEVAAWARALDQEEAGADVQVPPLPACMEALEEVRQEGEITYFAAPATV